jgi:hypothetical protein
MGLRQWLLDKCQPNSGYEPMDFGRGGYPGAWWERVTQDSVVEQPQALDLTDLRMVNRDSGS